MCHHYLRYCNVAESDGCKAQNAQLARALLQQTQQVERLSEALKAQHQQQTRISRQLNTLEGLEAQHEALTASLREATERFEEERRRLLDRAQRAENAQSELTRQLDVERHRASCADEMLITRDKLVEQMKTYSYTYSYILVLYNMITYTSMITYVYSTRNNY